MDFINLLGSELKSEEIIELLELFEVEVIYDFDRLWENTEDQYWASFYEEGYLFKFNQSQKLVAIFLYIKPKRNSELLMLVKQIFSYLVQLMI